MNKWLNQFFKEIEKEKYDNTVMPKMWDILNEISEKTGFDEHRILMLSLYGSQNYRMNNENSDIDTECFIFPSHDDIIYARPLFSKCIETPYGTCHVKDIRAAFNELRKSSPNILEILASPYMIINREYYFLIKQMCCDHIDYIATLNLYKLMRGLDGLYNKYRSEMNTSNKAYANMLRIENIMTSVLLKEDYTKELIPHNYISLKAIKYSDKIDTELREKTENGYSAVLRANVNKFYDRLETDSDEEVLGTINFWQSELMDKYIRLEL